MKDMTQGKPLKLIIGFAIPMLIGNIFQQVYNVADRRKILGRERAGGRGKHGNADLFSAGTGQRHV